MMGAPAKDGLLQRLMQADEFGLKLEVVEGAHTWEFFPSPLHQGAVQKIQRSIRSTELDANSCSCFSIRDVYIKFPDNSIKRPDIAIFCNEPALTREALTVVPDAVLEVVSPGSEHKDLEIGPPFYLAQGVRDVIVSDPDSGRVVHFKRDRVSKLTSPATILLECGCQLTA